MMCGCSGRGYVLEPALELRPSDPLGGASQATPCACKAGSGVADLAARWRHIGVPVALARPWDASLRGARLGEEAVDRWLAASDGRGLVLHGRRGAGKSRLAALLVERGHFSRGMRFAWADTVSLYAELRSSYAARGQTRDVLGRLLEAPILVLDGVGGGRNSEWERSVLDHLISHRYNTCRALVLTTSLLPVSAGSLSLPSMQEWLGDRLMSRLHEISTFYHHTGDAKPQGAK